MLACLPLLAQRGFEARLIAPHTGPLADRAQELGITLVPFDPGPGESIARRRERLARIFWRLAPKLLHANSLSMSRLSGPLAASLHLPSLGHLRDIIRLNRAAIDDLNQHRRVLAVSNATRDFHVAQTLQADIVHVVYNGVDLEQFCPEIPTGYLHRELNLPDGAPLITVIGQIGLRKGQDFLLEALEQVFETNLDIRLLIVGRRWSEKDESLRFEQALRDKADVEPFRGRVHFVGVRNDIPRLLNESTLLVHPARQEPLGRVLLEAAACGVPVVATDVGGTSEIFPESRFDIPCDIKEEIESARIVPADSPGWFCNAVCSLLDSPSDRRRIGAAARRRVEDAFSREQTAENLVGHYEAVLSGDYRFAR